MSFRYIEWAGGHGSSVVVVDEAGGTVETLAQTEADYSTDYYYDVTVYSQLYASPSGLQPQSCEVFTNWSTTAVCGLELPKMVGYT